jgi:metal-dependent amidase/aminoacylase/carboxypeptidase family protein
MPVLNRIADAADELTAWRQDLHAHPELGFQETRTSDVVAAKLAEWGIEVTRGHRGGDGVALRLAESRPDACLRA